MKVSKAYIVLDKKAREVARVTFYERGYSIECEVLTIGEGVTHKRKCGGYGYDKFTASLAGAVIAGYKMADHCGRVEEETQAKIDRLFKKYRKAVELGLSYDETRLFWEPKFKKHGFHFANYREGGFTSIFPRSGLERLADLGFRVIQAV